MSSEGGVWSDVAGPDEAAVLVLVHGSMDRSAGLLRLSRRLDGARRIVRYDRRGYGRSAGIGPPFSVEANVADLAAVVERSAPDAAVDLFGHSFGGNVVLAYAARHLERVRSVIVYETPMSWFEWWPKDSAGSTAMAAPDPEAAAEAFIRRLVGDDRWEALSEAKREQRRAEGVPMVAELADLRQRPPWRPDQIGVPVLAMYGEHARPQHRRGMEMLTEVLADCVSVEVPGAGHPGPNTHPDAVAARITAFIGSR